MFKNQFYKIRNKLLLIKDLKRNILSLFNMKRSSDQSRRLAHEHAENELQHSLVVWSYNMRNHYTLNHPSNHYPEKYLLSDDEVKKLEALRFK